MRENILPRTLMGAFHALRFVPIRYFAIVHKTNRRSKVQERAIILTDLHLYSCSTNDGAIRRCITLEHIQKVYTCKSRGEVALVVFEEGQEYDLLFEINSTAVAGIDEFLSLLPSTITLTDFAASLFSRPVMEEMKLVVEKPKGYHRDVADSVKWKVSSWTSLEKPSQNASAAKPPQPSASSTTDQRDPNTDSNLAKAEGGVRDSLQQEPKKGVSNTSTSIWGEGSEDDEGPPPPLPATTAAVAGNNNLDFLDDDDDGLSVAVPMSRHVHPTTRTNNNVPLSETQSVNSGLSNSFAVGRQVPSTPREKTNFHRTSMSLDDEDSDGDDPSSPLRSTPRGLPAALPLAPPPLPVSTPAAVQQQPPSAASASPRSNHSAPRSVTTAAPRTYLNDLDNEAPPSDDERNSRGGGAGADDDDDWDMDFDIAFDRVHPKVITGRGGGGGPVGQGGNRSGSSTPRVYTPSNASIQNGAGPSKPPAVTARGTPSQSSNGSMLPLAPPRDEGRPQTALRDPQDSTTTDSAVIAALREQLHAERMRYSTQLLLTSELLSVERENNATLRHIVEELRAEVESLVLENALLKRPTNSI